MNTKIPDIFLGWGKAYNFRPGSYMGPIGYKNS